MPNCWNCGAPNAGFGFYLVNMGWMEQKAPVKLCRVCYGKIKEIRNTSLDIEVEARRTSTYNGSQKVICTTMMKFVRIDGDGEPVPIAPHIHQKVTNKKNKNEK